MAKVNSILPRLAVSTAATPSERFWFILLTVDRFNAL